MFKKVIEYLDAGSKLVWAIYPDEQRVYVFCRIDDTLNGGVALPGFSLPVRKVFPQSFVTCLKVNFTVGFTVGKPLRLKSQM